MQEQLAKAGEKVKQIAESAKELAGESKGAILGGLAMYFLANNEQAKSALLGMIGGDLLIDKKLAEKNERKEEEDENAS